MSGPPERAWGRHINRAAGNGLLRITHGLAAWSGPVQEGPAEMSPSPVLLNVPLGLVEGQAHFAVQFSLDWIWVGPLALGTLEGGVRGSMDGVAVQMALYSLSPEV